VQILSLLVTCYVISSDSAEVTCAYMRKGAPFLDLDWEHELANQ